MRLEMNAFHICLLFFIFFVQRKKFTHKHKKQQTDNFKHLFKCISFKFPWVFKVLTSMISLFLLFNHEQTMHKMHYIFESIIVMLIYTFTISSFKKCANPENEINQTNYTFIISLMLSLYVCYYNVIHSRNHFSYLTMSMLLQTIVLFNDKKSSNTLTTTQIINDFAMTVLVFMVYKRHLKFI